MLREYLAIGKLIALLGAIGLLCFQSSQIHHWHTQYDAEHSGRMADRAAYAQAQKDAAQANKAQVAKVEQQQQKVTSDVESDYQRKLDALRRELRAQPKAAPGAAGSAGLSQVPDSAGGPAPEAGMPLSPDERLRAAENELQLDELITWVEQQMKVDPNGK